MSREDRGARAFEDAVEELPLVDHHVHGALRIPLDREAFERGITESDRGLAPGTSAFDSQVGFAIRRWCSPLLGLEPHADPDSYIAARAALGPEETNRRLLVPSGVSHYLVDTGFATDDLLDLAGMAAASGRATREIVRLEGLAEEVAASGVDAGGFQDAFVERLGARIEAGAVGTKSIVAYRHGFDVDPSRPAPDEVAKAVSGWFAGESTRLADPTLLRLALWSGIDAGVPMQIHVGFGDSDLHLARANPLLLTDFIKRAEPSGTPIMLLHCFPFHREAGYLAHIYPNVYFDVGVVVNYLGAQSRQLVAESLEVGPFAKQLFSSDAWGPAELHHLGALLWRRSLTDVVGAWIRSGDWSADDGIRVASMIGHGNAERVYRLER
ncbi:MAG: amidohydrolase family protein [Actinomycetota bacterium]